MAAHHHHRLPRLPAALIRALLPFAERDEVMGDLQAEYGERVAAQGERAARRWLREQALGSLPALLNRGWWRGMTGFEPRANQLRPGGPMFESWIMDARYVARRLQARPVYAALAILTLALGAGGTAAIFSVARTILLKPLPIVREQNVGVFWFSGSWNESEFLHLRTRFPGFERVAAYRPDNATLETPGAPLSLVEGLAASAELFDVLGARPMLGRTFAAGDDRAGAPPSSVLSYRLWQELGSNPAIVGKPIRLGGITRTVIGVMPRSFWYPSPTTQVWNSTPFNPQNRAGMYTLVGRTANGVPIDQMDGQARAIGAMLGQTYKYSPQWDKTKSPAIIPVREFLVGEVSPSVNATFAAMAVILLMACANVAALLLGQVDAQASDMAVRAALGADRRRLVQQLVIESLLIGLLAGAAGAGLAAAGFSLLIESLPLGDLAEGTRLDWTVFWASILAALVAAVGVAFVPGVALWRRNLQVTMAAKRTGGVAGRGGGMESALVVAQVALALLLASGASLLIRTVGNLRAIHPGLDVENVVVLDVMLPTSLTTEGRRLAILETLPKLESLPGVTSAGASQKLPLRGSGDNWGIRIKGKPDAGGTTAFRVVSRDYFKTLGMRIARGRGFEPGDRKGSERVAIINEALAAKYFPNEDPIGHVILNMDQIGERVIGVVSNAAEADLIDAPVPARYLLVDQVPAAISPGVSFVLKTGPGQQVPALTDLARSAIRNEGSRLALQKATTTGDMFHRALGPAGQVVTLLSLLAAIALLLGAVGVYGVISHHVARRSRDYGICIALGERPARVVFQVVRRSLTLVAIGAVIGLAAAIPLTRLLSALLYGVEPADPIALGATVAVLFVVGTLAAFAPARRASLTDPAVVLRQA